MAIESAPLGEPEAASEPKMTTILKVDASNVRECLPSASLLVSQENWKFSGDVNTPDFHNLQLAAHNIRTSDVPVAFPTETVYGLGADARRSTAVKGIYKAKQRPSDNPLIVHIASLHQLRQLLVPAQLACEEHNSTNQGSIQHNETAHDPIPRIYKPLIQKFWPGPLTIILPKPQDSVLAPEVTAGLDTFGARMPKSALALALIKLAGVPVAAPSANASTKPSPTAAEHVLDDLAGRIEYIVDGGPCEVGVESTVVDGLSNPPLILRPGGISIQQLRQCSGWETVANGYKEVSEKGIIPRAPGMKYRHYSPNATVVLYEQGAPLPSLSDFSGRMGDCRRVGIIRTKAWPCGCGLEATTLDSSGDCVRYGNGRVPYDTHEDSGPLDKSALSNGNQDDKTLHLRHMSVKLEQAGHLLSVWEINLGGDSDNIARALFSALRELDKKHVETIFVEGISDEEGDVAAAVMNRLRKASQLRIDRSA